MSSQATKDEYWKQATKKSASARRWGIASLIVSTMTLVGLLLNGCAFSTARYQDAVTDYDGNVLKAGHLKHTSLTFMAESESQGTIDFSQGAPGSAEHMSILLNAAAQHDSSDFITGLTALGGILAATQGISPAAPIAAIVAPVAEQIAQPEPIILSPNPPAPPVH